MKKVLIVLIGVFGITNLAFADLYSSSGYIFSVNPQTSESKIVSLQGSYVKSEEAKIISASLFSRAGYVFSVNPTTSEAKIVSIQGTYLKSEDVKAIK